jgi:hypothetical protein
MVAMVLSGLMVEVPKGNDGCAGVGCLRNFSGLWATTTLVAKAAGLLVTVMVSATVAVERKTVAGAVSAAKQLLAVV